MKTFLITVLLVSAFGSYAFIEAKQDQQKETGTITQTEKDSTTASKQGVSTEIQIVLFIFFVCIPFGVFSLFLFINRNGGTFKPMP